MISRQKLKNLKQAHERYSHHSMRLMGLLFAVLCIAILFGCGQGADDEAAANEQLGLENEQAQDGAGDGVHGDAQKGTDEENNKHSDKHSDTQRPSTLPWSPEHDSIEGYIAELSLREKIGQMIIAGVNGTKMSKNIEDLISSHHVGGFIMFKRNIKSAKQLSQLMNEVRAYHAGIGGPPLFLSVDQEGGRVTRLPHTSAMPTAQAVGAVDDAELSYSVGEMLGAQLQHYGMNMNFAPVLDIYSNTANTVIGNRAYGSTAEAVMQHGIEVMQGIAANGVIPVIKHFPGHGDTAADSHYDLPVVTKDKTELHAFEWEPFRAAIDAGADVVMSSHIVMTDIDEQHPATLSKALMTDVLRNELHFSGVVMTDDMTMGAIMDHYGLGEAAVLAVQAGNDIVLISHGYDYIVSAIEAIEQAVHSGEIDEATIDASVHRILKLKLRYNLTDEPREVVSSDDIAILMAAIAELNDRM